MLTVVTKAENMTFGHGDFQGCHAVHSVGFALDIILFKGNSVDVNEAVVFDFNYVTCHANYSLHNGITLPRNVKDNNVTTLDFGNLVEDEGVPLFYCFHHVAIAVRHVLSAVQSGEHTVTAHRDCGDDVGFQK